MSLAVVVAPVVVGVTSPKLTRPLLVRSIQVVMVWGSEQEVGSGEAVAGRNEKKVGTKAPPEVLGQAEGRSKNEEVRSRKVVTLASNSFSGNCR